MRLWPDSLAGRTVALLLGTTLLLIIGAAVLLQDERSARFDEKNRFHLVERIASMMRLLDDASDVERQRIIERIAEPGDEILLTERPRIDRPPRYPIEHAMARRLFHGLRLQERSDVRVQIERDNGGDVQHWRDRAHHLKSVSVSVRMWDGLWLNYRTDRLGGPPPWAGKTLQLLALFLILVGVSGLIIARRMARPMAQLADAAKSFGLGQSHTPLVESGPREVRETIRAFNQMQERLHRYINERSQMLAAVSHDLRTPITTLRLRAEYIEDPEMRDKTLATLADMEAIVSSTLAFARDDAADETSRPTDIAALLQAIVDDHADLGGNAQYSGPDRLTIACRPVALKRALNNLVENALNYGQQARVSLSQRDCAIEIRVHDQGPGIDADQLEAVFEPFYRVESSRNRRTGGTGLGLAVAKTIVLAHGGAIRLENLPNGGLGAVVSLPQ